MPYSNLTINPNAGSVSPFAGLDASQWSLGNATQNINNMNAGGSSAFGGMMSGLLSGGIGAASSLLGTIINGIFAKKAAQRQFDMNKKLMDYQNEMQRDMLTDEMALKMQGLKNAGLSTASLAGNFSNNTAVPSQSVGAPQATAQDMRLGDIFNAARQVKLQEDAIQSQIDLNEANAQKALASARNDYSTAGKTDVEKYLLQVYGARKYETEIANLTAEEQKKLADRDYIVQKKINEMNLNEKEIQLLQQQYDINWKKLPKELALLSAQAYREYQQGNLAKKQCDEVQQKIYNLQRERDNIVRQGHLTDVQADLLEAEIAKLAAETQNITPSALYSKAKEYLMNKFPRLVKFGVGFDTALGYVRQLAEIYSMIAGRGGSSGSVTTVSSGSGPKGDWSSISTTTRN